MSCIHAGSGSITRASAAAQAPRPMAGVARFCAGGSSRLQWAQPGQVSSKGCASQPFRTGGCSRRSLVARSAQQETQQATAVIPPFHIAFPVRDVEEARSFYLGVLGCSEGRSAKTWVDFNLYGHQIVAHLVKGYNAANSLNAVDGDAVPVPHFGVALSVDQFHQLANRLKAVPDFKFVIEPHLRFEGKPGEQWTMFFYDPSGNAIEFKAMTNPANLFAKYRVD